MQRSTLDHKVARGISHPVVDFWQMICSSDEPRTEFWGWVASTTSRIPSPSTHLRLMMPDLWCRRNQLGKQVVALRPSSCLVKKDVLRNVDSVDER